MITVVNGKLSTNDLKSLTTLKPEKAGDRWRGVPHYDLATTLESRLQSQHIEVTRSAWTTGRNDQHLFGGLQLRFPKELGIPSLEGMEYALGVRHANDMSMSIQFFAGVNVMICANGVATGSFILARKHTSGIDLKTEIDRGIGRLIAEAKVAGAVVQRMRERPLSTKEADHILCEAGRRHLLSWGHIGLVDAEYASPEHDEFRGRNAWCLYNAFNSVVKRTAPGRQLKALDQFRSLVIPAKEVEAN